MSLPPLAARFPTKFRWRFVGVTANDNLASRTSNCRYRLDTVNPRLAAVMPRRSMTMSMVRARSVFRPSAKRPNPFGPFEPPARLALGSSWDRVRPAWASANR